MTSPLAMPRIAQGFQGDFVELREQFDQSLRRSIRMYASEHEGPITTSLLSRLARHKLGVLSRRGQQVRADGTRSRLRLKVDGNDNVKVYAGSLFSARVRLRPKNAFEESPVLVEPDGSIPGVFEVPVPLGKFVFLWNWDEAVNAVRSFSLARVATLSDWRDKGCLIYEELAIEPSKTTLSAPMGAGSDEDDLDDMVFRRNEDGYTDESGQFSATDFDDDEEDDDAGDASVGDAG